MRRLVIAVVSTAIVFAMTLVLTGLANGFHVEAQRTVDSLGVDAFVVKAGAAGPFLGSTPFAPVDLPRGDDDQGRRVQAKRHGVRSAGARTGHAARLGGPGAVDA